MEIKKIKNNKEYYEDIIKNQQKKVYKYYKETKKLKKMLFKIMLLFLIIQSNATVWFFIGKYDLNQLWGGLSLILIAIPIALILNWMEFDKN